MCPSNAHVRIELTQNGRRVVDAALEQHVETERQLVAALTAAQQTQLVDLLRRLLIALGDDVGARAALK